MPISLVSLHRIAVVPLLCSLALTAALRQTPVAPSQCTLRYSTPRRWASVVLSEVYCHLEPDSSAGLASAQPSPALQPREVIALMLSALHRTNFDSPRPRFGCEVAMRFLAPSNPASRATPERFADYLSQTWYRPLLDWDEYRWEGDLTLLGEKEAYQQVAVRGDQGSSEVSVRWILVRVPFYGATDQWMVQAVFVEEPDGSDEQLRLFAPLDTALPIGRSSAPAAAAADAEALAAAEEGPADVVLKVIRASHRLACSSEPESSRTPPNADPSSTTAPKVMRAVRKIDEPYPLHGCEVAIRYCSPTNKASRLSPQSFAQYLDEPWYRILTEWDEIELNDDPEAIQDDASTVELDVLVRRQGEDTWTIVAWRLSRHAGLWLTDSLSITG